MELTGITGGIGSGKSMVSRLLRLEGHPVYDCDLEARCLMESDPKVRDAIRALAGEEAYLADGSLNRPHLANLIFSIEEKRLEVNRIVHQAVRRDLLRWMKSQQHHHPVEAGEGRRLFVESAILASSGLLELVSEVWLVEASLQTRVERILARNNCTAQEAEARIQSQAAEAALMDQWPGKMVAIDNDGQRPLLPQVREAMWG